MPLVLLHRSRRQCVAVGVIDFALAPPAAGAAGATWPQRMGPGERPLNRLSAREPQRGPARSETHSKGDAVDITGKTALVTGANRGLGRHLAAELRDRGARVYAAARDPQTVDLAGVTPIALDITDPASVAAAAQAATGVAILVNNAGSSTGASLLTGDLAAIRLEMNTHFFGTLAVTRAFALWSSAVTLKPR
jgi:short chain dehydrogenase